MPTVLRIQGYRVGFFSADWDEPAHVHVTKSGNTAKVWLNPVQLAFNAGYRRDELMKSSASSKKTSKDSWKPGMNTLDEIRVLRVSSTADTLIIDFEDGRTVHLPLIWYPRLYRATQAQRDRYELTGRGYGVHWPGVDEDLSAKSLALGKPSIEFLKQQPKPSDKVGR